MWKLDLIQQSQWHQALLSGPLPPAIMADITRLSASCASITALTCVYNSSLKRLRR